jgi:hypothetical protein
MKKLCISMLYDIHKRKVLTALRGKLNEIKYHAAVV